MCEYLRRYRDNPVVYQAVTSCSNSRRWIPQDSCYVFHHDSDFDERNGAETVTGVDQSRVIVSAWACISGCRHRSIRDSRFSCGDSSTFEACNGIARFPNCSRAATDTILNGIFGLVCAGWFCWQRNLLHEKTLACNGSQLPSMVRSVRMCTLASV